VIITFAKLQRLSCLEKPTAIKAWMKRAGLSYILDAKGRPFTTLDALNRKLHRAADDGFSLEDPEPAKGRPRQKRTLLQDRPQSLDCVDQGGRGAGGVASGAPRYAYQPATGHGGRATGGVLATGGNHGHDEAGI
jgi:hypothetical protein